MSILMSSNNCSVVALAMMFLRDTNVFKISYCGDLVGCSWDFNVFFVCNLLVSGDWNISLACVCLISVDISCDWESTDEWMIFSDIVVLEGVDCVLLLLLLLVLVDVQVTCIIRLTVFGVARVFIAVIAFLM